MQELNEVKSHNLHLMEQTQADKLKLQETEDSMKELEKVGYEQKYIHLHACVLPLNVDH